MIAVLSLALLLMASFGANAHADAVNCRKIYDSAQCSMEAKCYFDVNERTCFDGPRPKEDACAVHEGEALCVTDKTLGCAWDAKAKACVTQAD
ncbi:MAG: hypothetical protein ACREDO_10880 [Methyloceanibacter sp.]